MKLFKEVCRLGAKRLVGFNDAANILPHRAEIHGFDCREIFKFWNSILGEVRAAAENENSDFDLRTNLPAERVWLQIDNDSAIVIFSGSYKTSSQILIYVVNSNGSAIPAGNESTFHVLSMCLLWMINTPSLVKRTLITSKKNRNATAPSSYWMSGDYEKVKIHIDGKVIDVSVSGEITGEMPFHFVRGHIRKCFNKQVWVRQHWRGNKEKGTKNRQYECVRS